MPRSTLKSDWWRHHYVIIAVVSFLLSAVLVFWTELASCADCPGRLIVAAGYKKHGSQSNIRFVYGNPSGAFRIPISRLTVEDVTPESAVTVALSDTDRCITRAGRSVIPDTSFSESELVKRPTPEFGDIIPDIDSQIKVYDLSPADLPTSCRLSANPTWLYFEARRVRVLDWISVPGTLAERKQLEPADSETIYLNEPDAQDVRIDDTTGVFQATKPSYDTLRVTLRRSPIAEERRRSALTTIDWSTRRRNHWHELLLFVAAALIGVTATCAVEEMKRWRSQDQGE